MSNTVPGQDYRIERKLQLLESERIIALLSLDVAKQIQLNILPEIDSTNQYMIDNASQLTSGSIVMAEYQSSGRGRRQRAWISPFGANIALSLLWNSELNPHECGSLSLASGVAVVHALERCGVNLLQLKWPNDVLWQGRKLCGVLIESAKNKNAKTQVVIGIGINVALPPTYLDQAWVDLTTILGYTPDRNTIAARLIEELVAMITLFQQQGFGPFVKHWQTLDAFYNQPVILSSPQKSIKGIAKGINRNGELLLSNDNGQEVTYIQGELSLRLDN